MAKYELLTTIVLLGFINLESKIVFQKQKRNQIEFIQYFYQDKLFPKMPYLAVIPLSFPDTDPNSFTFVMKLLNENCQNSLMLLDKVNNHERINEYYLIFQTQNETGRTFNILETVGQTVFGLIAIFIWCAEDVSSAVRKNISIKATTLRIFKIYFLYSSDIRTDEKWQKEGYARIPCSRGVFIGYLQTKWRVNSGLSKCIDLITGYVLKCTFLQKVTCKTQEVNSREVTLVVKHVLLSQNKYDTPNEITFKINHKNINRVLKQVRTLHRMQNSQLLKLPIKVLGYLRPMSVEILNPENRTIRYIGVDMSILKLVVEKLNVSHSLKIGHISDYGSVYKNGSYTNAYRDILSRKTEININRYPMDDMEPGLAVIPYDDEKFCFIIRMPKNQVRTWSILMAFETPVWIVLFGVYISVFIIFMLIKERHWNNIWIVQSILSSVQLPVVRAAHRIFWASWLLFIVIINNGYLSLYVTQLIPAKKSTTYNTLASLIRNNFTLLTEVGHFEIRHPALVQNSLIPFYGKTHEINENVALLTSQFTRIKLNKMYGSDFYVVNECLAKGFVGPVMSPNHLLYSKTTIIFAKITSAGLISHWVNDYLERHAPIYTSNIKRYDRPSYAPIKIGEMSFIFKYCLIGWIISIVAFLCEVSYFRLYKRNVKGQRPKIIKVFPYVE